MKTIKTKGLGQAERLALVELKSMVPFFLICDGIILIICGVCAFFGVLEFDFTILTGLAFGNVAGAGNFFLMALANGRAMLRRSGDPRVKSTTGFGYGVRLIALFIIYGALITFELINPFISVIPLLYPSFYYKFKAIFKKSV